VLRQFKAEEDPENKLLIITAEDEGHQDGFWLGEKDEMSQAYAKRATGNYLWQVDVDEFYLESDMPTIMKLLQDGVDSITFPQLTFWGGGEYITDGFFLRGYEYHRIFRWGPEYKYVSHRPPTVVNESGFDTRNLNWLNYNIMVKIGIYLYHYSLLFPFQVMGKAKYYSKRITWEKCAMEDWAVDNYLKITNPYRVHNVYKHISWLERYLGPVPHQITCMMNDIKDGKLQFLLRDTADIELLFADRKYTLNVSILKLLSRLLAIKLVRITRQSLYKLLLWLKISVTDPARVCRAIAKRLFHK
jgi:hypothetical protein